MSDPRQAAATVAAKLSPVERRALLLAEVLADLVEVSDGLTLVVDRLEPVGGFQTHRATAQGMVCKCYELRADILQDIDKEPPPDNA